MVHSYSRLAIQQLARFSHLDQIRIKEKVIFYCSQDNPLFFAKFIQTEKRFRFRVGNHRIYFEVINGTIWIVKIERRDKAY